MSTNPFVKNDHNVYQALPLKDLDWLQHGFGTRHSDWDGHALTTLKQVHSDRVLVADGAAGCIGEGDALITDRPGIILSVRTADCVPILLVEDQRRAVAAIHAGWRGTACAIVVRAVERLCLDFSCEPKHMHAAIGPAINVCCYEVGKDVAERFGAFLPELPLDGTHAMLDLIEANRRQLLQAGIPSDRIYSGAPCTSCTPSEFFSYRRERSATGRMVSIIGLKGP